MDETFPVPKKNKEIFINPPYKKIPNLIDLNKERFLSYDFEINGVPFSEFRKHARSETIKRAGEYSDKMLSICSKLNIRDKRGLFTNNYSPGNTIIQTGHAPILAHPGVLIKNSLADCLAKKVSGIGVNMAVDNDVCHDNCINIPNVNGSAPTMEKFEFVSMLKDSAFEEIGYSNSMQLTALRKDILQVIHNHEMKNTFNEFIDIAIKLSEETQSLSDLLTYARHAYLQKFDINNLEIPVSLMCRTGSFWNFFLHITGDIKNFAKIYNARLEEYRKLKKIRSKANPLPNLEEKRNITELPFWIWRENGPRKKLFASLENDRQAGLIFENEVIAVLDFRRNGNSSENIRRLKGLENKGMKIRPKAVTNTMYSRMFFSDLFIHGVGGAKYDLITDEIIRDFFGVEPPEYATISATLHLPYIPYDVCSEDAENIKHTIANMNRHPEKYISKEIMKIPEIQFAINEKKDLITKETHNQTEKRQAFNRLKQINDMMKEKIKPLIMEKEKEAEEIEKKLRYNSIVKNREYPFCIYPESMVRELYKSYRGCAL